MEIVQSVQEEWDALFLLYLMYVQAGFELDASLILTRLDNANYFEGGVQ